MRRILGISFAGLASILLFTGCGKSSDKQEAIPEIVDAAQYVPGLPPGTMLQTRITGAVHAYHEKTGRWPANFDELVTAKLLDKVPDPPAGKKFVFDRKSLQVLVVPQ